MGGRDPGHRRQTDPHRDSRPGDRRAECRIGLLARRWRTAGLVLLVVLVTLAGLAAVGRPSAGQLAVVPSLLAGLTGVIALTWLCRLADLESEPAGSGRPESPLDHTAYAMGRPGRPGRRSFVTAAAGTGIGALTVGGVVPWPVGERAPWPHNLSLAERACSSLAARSRDDDAGISALRTPRDEFYRIDTALTIPRVDVSSWTLTIDGMVDHKVVVTWAELLAMDLIERDVTINCEQRGGRPLHRRDPLDWSASAKHPATSRNSR